MAENNEVVGGAAQLFDELAKYNKLLLSSKCLGFF